MGLFNFLKKKNTRKTETKTLTNEPVMFIVKDVKEASLKGSNQKLLEILVSKDWSDSVSDIFIYPHNKEHLERFVHIHKHRIVFVAHLDEFDMKIEFINGLGNTKIYYHSEVILSN